MCLRCQVAAVLLSVHTSYMHRASEALQERVEGCMSARRTLLEACAPAPPGLLLASLPYLALAPGHRRGTALQGLLTILFLGIITEICELTILITLPYSPPLGRVHGLQPPPPIEVYAGSCQAFSEGLQGAWHACQALRLDC